MENFAKMFEWTSNPFTYTIIPEVFVGYAKEMNDVFSAFKSGNKFSLLLGPTGSGKTTFLRALLTRFSKDEQVIYLPKPPKVSSEWIVVFNPIIKYGGFFRFPFKKKDLNIYNLGEQLNSRLKEKKCLLLIDECHEATIESLEWLRTLADHTDNLSIVLTALPNFENTLKNNLETLMKRINYRAELSNLSKSETREFIKKRIEFAGGDDIRPFTSSTVEYIYEKTGGFPREILKLCNSLLQKSVEKNITTIDIDFLEETANPPEKLTMDSLKSLPEKQRMILEMLKGKELTPAEITAQITLEDYKDRDNALRSANNLLRRLIEEKLVERVKAGKTYKYRLSNRMQTLMVSA